MLQACTPADALAFADVCWTQDDGRIPFYDVHVRSDITPLRPLTAVAGETDPPGLAPAPGRIVPNKDQFVLAHGEVVAAVLVDDPCQIEDVLGRGDTPSGRLLCAAVRGSAGPNEMQLTQKFSILPVAGVADTLDNVKPFKHGAIIDVERLFTVRITDADDVAWLTDRRIGRLDDDDSARLLWRLAAHCVRRGPLVSEDAGRKLRVLLDQINHPNSEAAAAAFSTLFGQLFQREGAIEDAISLIHDDQRDPSALPAALDALYAEIERSAAQARSALTS